jgi:hypothetical protein
MKRRGKKPPPPPKAVRRAERRARWTRVLGLAFCAAGFAAVALGWAGAARKNCVDCQIPYLISGGAAGVALMIFGVGLLVMAQMRTESRRLSGRLEHMTWTLAERFMGSQSSAVGGDSIGPSKEKPKKDADPRLTESPNVAPAEAGDDPIDLSSAERASVSTPWWERERPG